MKSVLIIGMGHMGRHLASKLQELGNEVMIVDKDPDVIAALSDLFTDANICDCTIAAAIDALICVLSPSERIFSPRSSSRRCSRSTAHA